MKKTALIPDLYDLKFIPYNGTTYCLDPNKPSILRISEDVASILVSGKGKSLEELREAFHDYHQAIANIANLKEKGFFQDCSPENSLEKPCLVNKLTMEVSAACNFSCIYCYGHSSDHTSRPNIMTQEVANQCIEHLAGSTGEIDFFGGEPLLNFDLICKVVDYCRRKGNNFKFAITTNGSLITAEIAAFLADNGFSVVVSLDGPETVHDEMRRSKNGSPTFHEVWRGIEILRKRLPVEKLVVSGVLTARFPFPEQILEGFKPLFPSRISLNTVSAPGKSGVDLDELSMRRLIEGERIICERILSGEISPFTKYLPIAQYMRFLSKGEVRRNRCGAGKDSIAIATDGKIYLCHRFFGIEAFMIGDIWDGIIEKKRAMFYQVSHLRERCAPCWARNICGGPCMHDSFAYTGSINDIVPLKCERTRYLIELAIIAFGELMKQGKQQLVNCL